MSRYQIKPNPDVGWDILDMGNVISTHRTNREAWLALDKLRNEPVSRKEHVTEWMSRANDS